MNGDLIHILEEKMHTFSKGQKLIAQYLINSYDKAAYMTAARLGARVGVSESTGVRFAIELGFEGYPELQKSLQELIRNKLTSVQRIQLTSDLKQDDVLKSVLKADMANIRATIDSIDNTAFNASIKALLDAEKVYIVGVRSAAPLAQFLAYYLNFVLDNVITVNMVVSDAYESMVRISEKDVCLGISFPRYSRRTIEAFTFAKSHGARLIAITDSPFSPVAELADHALIARSDMASFADSLAAPLSLINAIIVATSLQRKDEVYERFSQLESIWGRQNVYVTKENGF